MKYLILTIITLAIVGCKCKKPTSSTDAAPKETVKALILDKEFIQPKENANFEILEASISDDILTLKVTYSGGCEAHEFNAYFNGVYMKSEPPKAGIFIEHISNGDLCKQLVTEELKFLITDVRYPDKDRDYKVMVGMNHYKGYLDYSY